MSALPATALPGRCEPMGAHVRDGGVNFALFSQNAERVELCLFDAAGATELKRYELHGPHDGVFNGTGRYEFVVSASTAINLVNFTIQSAGKDEKLNRSILGVDK